MVNVGTAKNIIEDAYKRGWDDGREEAENLHGSDGSYVETYRENGWYEYSKEVDLALNGRTR